MTIKPRDYQQDAIMSIPNYFSSGGTGNPLVLAPTGTGKSVIIAGFLEWVYSQWPTQKILMLTHVKELIEQNYEKLELMLPHLSKGINSASIGRRDYLQPVICCGIGSVAKDAWKFGHVDLILVDECDLISQKSDTMYRKFIDDLSEINPALKVIGFTATPWRLGRGSIVKDEDNIFTDICFNGISIEAFNWFFDQGYLIPVTPKPTDLEIDVSGVSVRGGEFVDKELQQAVDQDHITEKAVRETIEWGHDRNAWLIFTTGIKHTEHVCEMLNLMGVEATSIHSKLTKKEREQRIKDFKAGRYKACVNANVLTTGFDYPDIDLIAVIRPTQSPRLWVQMLGRGTRPVFVGDYDLSTREGRLAAIEESGKLDCLVLDFGGNTLRLGPINDPVIIERGNRKKKKLMPAPVKVCERCGTFVHASLRFCNNINPKTHEKCGYEFKFETKLKENASTADLIKKDVPIVENFKVDHITFNYHVGRNGKPASIKFTYYCGLKRFNSYLCLEHGSYTRRNAVEFWRARTSAPAPETTLEAMEKIDTLQTPTHLKVWVNKTYPEIMQYCFDGSNFGTEQASANIVPIKKVNAIQRKRR